MFLGALGGEGVAGVEVVVAEEDVKGAVESVGGGFGDDFDATAAPAGIFGGVGVVVDADLLDGGGGHAYVAHLHAVDDEGGAGAAGVEEAGEGGDVVVVEHRQVVEHRAFDGDGVGVGAGLGGDGAFGFGDFEGFFDAANDEADFEGGGVAGAELELQGNGVEAGGGGLEFVVTGGKGFEAEVAVGVGGGGTGLEGDDERGDRGAGGVEDATSEEEEAGLGAERESRKGEKQQKMDQSVCLRQG